MGKPKLSINNIFKKLFEKQSIISETELNCLKAYNSEIERGVSPMTAYYPTMQTASDAAVKIAHSARDAIVDLKQISKVAKIDQVVMQGLATAGNMLAGWAISKGIELVVKGIDNLAHSSEHCKERVDELISSYQSALDTANSNAKTVENFASRHEKLSNGVNNLGENIGLTTEEYSEYNNIVNQIADMFPNLIKGYTNEENAILLLKGNVEQLRNAYKEAQEEAYNTLITSGQDSGGNDIIKNFKNTTKSNYIVDTFTKGFLGIFQSKEISSKVYIETIKALQEKMLSFNGDNWFSAQNSILSELNNKYHLNANQDMQLRKTISDIGFNKFELTDEDKRNINQKAKAYIQKYQAEIDSALNGENFLLMHI